MINLIPAESENDIQQVTKLFRAYAESLGFDLSFQDFEKELAELPGEYAPPSGRLLLAKSKTHTAGCAALRKITSDISEMKRLYVLPEFRGKGIGRQLAEAIIEEARRIGYIYMHLDTAPSMKEAIALYRSLGFKEAEPYRYNPIAGALYFGMVLK